MILLMIHLIISLGTLLAHENMKGIIWFVFKSGIPVQLGGPLINYMNPGYFTLAATDLKL